MDYETRLAQSKRKEAVDDILTAIEGLDDDTALTALYSTIAFTIVQRFPITEWHRTYAHVCGRLAESIKACPSIVAEASPPERTN